MDEAKKNGSKKSLVIAAVCLIAAAAALFAVWRLNAPRGSEGSKAVAIQVIHKDGSSKDFSLHTDEEFLGRALVEGGVVEDNQGPYGLYILTADGETADESAQEWWQITKNGESLTTGADAAPIADGEHYELTLTAGW